MDLDPRLRGDDGNGWNAEMTIRVRGDDDKARALPSLDINVGLIPDLP